MKEQWIKSDAKTLLHPEDQEALPCIIHIPVSTFPHPQKDVGAGSCKKFFAFVFLVLAFTVTSSGAYYFCNLQKYDFYNNDVEIPAAHKQEGTDLKISSDVFYDRLIKDIPDNSLDDNTVTEKLEIVPIDDDGHASIPSKSFSSEFEQTDEKDKKDGAANESFEKDAATEELNEEFSPEKVDSSKTEQTEDLMDRLYTDDFNTDVKDLSVIESLSKDKSASEKELDDSLKYLDNLDLSSEYADPLDIVSAILAIKILDKTADGANDSFETDSKEIEKLVKKLDSLENSSVLNEDDKLTEEIINEFGPIFNKKLIQLLVSKKMTVPVLVIDDVEIKSEEMGDKIKNSDLGKKVKPLADIGSILEIQPLLTSATGLSDKSDDDGNEAHQTTTTNNEQKSDQSLYDDLIKNSENVNPLVSEKEPVEEETVTSDEDDDRTAQKDDSFFYAVNEPTKENKENIESSNVNPEKTITLDEELELITQLNGVTQSSLDLAKEKIKCAKQFGNEACFDINFDPPDQFFFALNGVEQSGRVSEDTSNIIGGIYDYFINRLPSKLSSESVLGDTTESKTTQTVIASTTDETYTEGSGIEDIEETPFIQDYDKENKFSEHVDKNYPIIDEEY